MKRNSFKRIFILLILSSIFGLLLGQPGCYKSNDTVVTKLNKPATDFTLTDIDNKDITLLDYKGKAIMLRFWTSRCPSCKKEMPVVDKIYRKYKDKGFVVLAVNIDDPRNVAAETARSLDLTFPVLLDQKMKVTRLYKVYATPTSFFIDRNGILKEKVLGELSERTIAMYLEGIL